MPAGQSRKSIPSQKTAGGKTAGATSPSVWIFHEISQPQGHGRQATENDAVSELLAGDFLAGQGARLFLRPLTNPRAVLEREDILAAPDERIAVGRVGLRFV